MKKRGIKRERREMSNIKRGKVMIWNRDIKFGKEPKSEDMKMNITEIVNHVNGNIIKKSMIMVRNERFKM